MGCRQEWGVLKANASQQGGASDTLKHNGDISPLGVTICRYGLMGSRPGEPGHSQEGHLVRGNKNRD